MKHPPAPLLFSTSAFRVNAEWVELRFKNKISFSRLKNYQTIFSFLLAVQALTIYGQEPDREASSHPVIFIETDAQGIPDEPKVMVRLKVADMASTLDTATLDYSYVGYAGLELRGRSSLGFPKKGYGLETREFDASNRETELLGLPVENDWVLHGPYADKSLIRNALTYQTGRALGIPAPRSKFCELVIDGELLGTYLLVEKVKRDKNRVDLDRPDSQTLRTGPHTDFLFKIDFDVDVPAEGWRSRNSYRDSSPSYTKYEYQYPKPTEITAQEAAYLQEYVDEVEQVLLGPEAFDPVEGYG